MAMPAYIQSVDNGVILDLCVQPNARKTEVVGEYQNRLKIRISSPPVEGKANVALCKYLSKTFGISRSKVNVIAGDSSRLKRVLLRQQSLAGVCSILERLTVE